MVWFITLPLALAGVESAHAAANAMFGAPAAELFDSPASGRNLLPLVVALALAATVVGLTARILGAGRTRRTSRALALPFVLLPPVAFVVLELGEALAGAGIGWRTVSSATFVAGLALQLPFALGGYVVARVLLRFGDEVGELLGRVALRHVWIFPAAIVAAGIERLQPALLPAPATARGPPPRFRP